MYKNKNLKRIACFASEKRQAAWDASQG